MDPHRFRKNLHLLYSIQHYCNCGLDNWHRLVINTIHLFCTHNNCSCSLSCNYKKWCSAVYLEQVEAKSGLSPKYYSSISSPRLSCTWWNTRNKQKQMLEQDKITALLFLVFFKNFKNLYLSIDSICFGAPYKARRQQIPKVRMTSAKS